MNTCLLALPSIDHSPKKKCCLLGWRYSSCLFVSMNVVIASVVAVGFV